MFTEKDLAQIKSLGISIAKVEEQIRNFIEGFPFLPLVRPAIVGDGISRYEKEEAQKWATLYETHANKEKIVKFVPASGAATRMFKHLFEFDGSEKALEKLKTDTGFNSVAYFMQHIREFAFYDDLKLAYQKKYNIDIEKDLQDTSKYVAILKTLLDEDGLQYGSLPKALLKFHKYPDGSVRTPIEEHMVEGAHHAVSMGNVVHLHFTVSPEHEAKFKARVAEVQAEYEKRLGVRFEISYSQQKRSTDTIAVDMNNQPFREEDGSLLFRPAGHGALLENLNDLHADIVFIKNIDNVVPDRLKAESYFYKKVLAGVLIHYRGKIFEYLRKLESGKYSQTDIEQIADFLQKELCTIPINGFEELELQEQADYLFAKLNRPIRVCGMVANSGETGGGPFWAKNQDGSISIQIVETAQIDVNHPMQKEIMAKSTHFNPADLVVSLKDYKGNKFNLLKYRDDKTGFISKKSKNGRDLKAQELPGLWNGSMSDWNTVFVEIPLITFNPVKTVNDLLRPEHKA
ncbi:MAG: DUF4301 family protein [Cytophagales bacterium]|nr:DUF4301 family protein [Cytophagales bacterium]MDW8383495.1 DUF4301 family protein [Flammeovirgaceae bacterium]